MQRRKPAYSLEEIARLVIAKQVLISKRVVTYLNNHGYSAREISLPALSKIAGGFGRHYKTVELNKRPGVWADIYIVNLGDGFWYVKLFVENGIVVWSCKPDGENW